MTTVLPTDLGGGPFAVSLQKVTKRYGRDTALDAVDLAVPEGAVYLLVGPNGAGKSTALKLLVDLARADAGTVEVFGLDPARRGPDVRAQVGYVPEHAGWGYGWMRVGDLLRQHATYFTSWNATYAAHLSTAFGLEPARRLGKLSKGQARRVSLLLALAHRPRLLVFDEPTDGLDPVMLDDTMALLSDHLAESPTTMLISTHHVHEIDGLADHVAVMHKGKLALQVRRDILHQKLRRYRAEVPDGWTGVAALNGTVLRKGALGNEIQWSVWGDEPEVVSHLVGAGATVRDVAPLPLEDATLALLGRRESS